jgi:transcriptional regulator with XRE-family HTH domain
VRLSVFCYQSYVGLVQLWRVQYVQQERAEKGIMNKALGDLIKRARAARTPRMTQETLAEAIGKSPGYVGQLESGRVDRPLPDTLRALSLALDLSMEELVTTTGQLDPPAATIEDFSQERIEAEVHRIAAIPTIEAKMEALKQLSPAVFELVESLVFQVTQESVSRLTRPETPRPRNGKRHEG